MNNVTPEEGAAAGRGDNAPLKLESFLPYRLNVVASLVSQALSRIYASRYGIGVPEWRVVVTLGQYGLMTGKAIGAHSHMHKTKVSRAVALLEKRKLVTRRANRADLREAFLALTPAGRAMYDDLAPIACEITYGLERIAMFLQRVDNVFDLEWGGGVKYAEVRLQEEIDQSKYAFGQVDMPAQAFAALHRDLFDKYFAFAETLLASGLIWPALEHTLKCSHLFNILDSSGSIGVTERTAYILRVRQLAVKLAKAYVDANESPSLDEGAASVGGLGSKGKVE